MELKDKFPRALIKIALWNVCLALIVAFFTSCGSGSSKEPKIHQLRINISREPTTLDPRKGGEFISSSMHYLLYEGLVRLSPHGMIIPAQAKSIEISDNRLVYTFHLRGSRWSNGELVTAKDFEYAWKKIISPEFSAPNAHLLYPIKNAEKIRRGEMSPDSLGVKSVDHLTLVVELERPTPYFLNLISFCVFFPVNHTIDSTKNDWVQNAGPQFTTNGPFKLAHWKHHQEIALEKNPYYWDSSLIRLDQIMISIIADENTALSLYENGELDLIGLGISPIPTDAIQHYLKKGLLKTHATPGTTFITFNINKYPFNNCHIRKAFAYAINRSQLVKNITQLGEEAATNILPPLLNPLKHMSYFKDHDISKAQMHLDAGLKELGISLKEFPKITFEYSLSDLNKKIAQVLQEQWNQILGIRVELSGCEHKVLLDKLGSRTYDLAQAFWIAQYNDPMNIFERFKFRNSTKNYPGWENQHYIELLEQSSYDQTSDQRAETLSKAEQLLLDEMPLTPLYHWKSSFLIKDHLTYEDFTESGAFDIARISPKEDKK